MTNQREGAALVSGDGDGRAALMSAALGGPIPLHHVDIINSCLRQNEETEGLLWQPQEALGSPRKHTPR